ncbi:hypothetical protein RCO48_18810 [Peribacillus frigoritolerans]|nr:hypothetical protein [Peribacillus frigoritolerans]
MIHFLLNIVTDIGKDIIVAVATSLIISAFSKKKEPLRPPRWKWFFF